MSNLERKLRLVTAVLEVKLGLSQLNNFAARYFVLNPVYV